MSTLSSTPGAVDAAAPVREPRGADVDRRPRHGLPAEGADSLPAQPARLLGRFLSPWRWSLLLRRRRLLVGVRLAPVRKRLLLRGKRLRHFGKRHALLGRRRMLLLRNRTFAQSHHLAQRRL